MPLWIRLFCNHAPGCCLFVISCPLSVSLPCAFWITCSIILLITVWLRLFTATLLQAMGRSTSITHQMEYLLATGNLVSRSGLALLQVKIASYIDHRSLMLLAVCSKHQGNRDRVNIKCDQRRGYFPHLDLPFLQLSKCLLLVIHIDSHILTGKLKWDVWTASSWLKTTCLLCWLTSV